MVCGETEKVSVIRSIRKKTGDPFFYQRINGNIASLITYNAK